MGNLKMYASEKLLKRFLFSPSPIVLLSSSSSPLMIEGLGRCFTYSLPLFLLLCCYFNDLGMMYASDLLFITSSSPTPDIKERVVT